MIPTNLWPEAAEPTPGFHEKDRVENYLHDQVCAGHLQLFDAQQMAATDWVAVYESLPATSAPAKRTVVPTVVPTAAARETNQPASTQSGTVQIVSAMGGRPGGRASVTAKGAPSATCSIAYTTPAGTPSTAQGLGTKTADASGAVSWTWSIGPSTRPGMGTVAVTCNAATAKSNKTIG